MVFRRIVISALLVGILTGLILSAVQFLGVLPIIFAAESYEIAEHAAVATWAPEAGVERSLHTLMANSFIGFGFALVLLALMSQLQMQGVTHINVFKGILWGLAGFAVFFIAPGTGLPPEIPGMQAAALEHRQFWWLLSVLCSAAALAVLVFAPFKFKAIGLLLIVLPFIIGVPHISGPEISHPDPDAVLALVQLHHQFLMASWLANLIFWLVSGIACAWILNCCVLKRLEIDGSTTGS